MSVEVVVDVLRGIRGRGISTIGIMTEANQAMVSKLSQPQ